MHVSWLAGWRAERRWLVAAGVGASPRCCELELSSSRVETRAIRCTASSVACAAHTNNLQLSVVGPCVPDAAQPTSHVRVHANHRSRSVRPACARVAVLELLCCMIKLLRTVNCARTAGQSHTVTFSVRRIRFLSTKQSRYRTRVLPAGDLRVDATHTSVSLVN